MKQAPYEKLITELMKDVRFRAQIARLIKADQGSEADVDDIFMKSLSILWQRLVSGMEIENPRAYLRQVVRWNWIQENKQRKSRKSKLEHHSFKTASESIEKHYLQKEQVDLILEKMREIGEPCSDILHLYYIEGIKQKEIHQHLKGDKTKEWVKRQFYKCRDKLRILIKGHPEINDFSHGSK